jgi:hypothetical protein
LDSPPKKHRLKVGELLLITVVFVRGGSEQWLPSGIALENIDQVRAVSEAVVVKSHPLPARIIDLVSDNTMRRSG